MNRFIFSTGLTFILAVLFLQDMTLSAQSFPIGHQTLTYIDSSRNNRQIPSELYYPAESAGNNTPLAAGVFPVIVFGHGFLMTYDVYSYLWNSLVPAGYILVFNKTESSITPNHSEYGKDLAFLVEQMKTEGNTPSSPFYEHVDSTSAIMGHSMGGGASFLACENNTVPTVMATFAAAETTPSAIAAATHVTIPTLVFAASQDCMTPPALNQVPMYDSLATDCKVYISITGGGHCYFADYNFQCSIGEIGCQQNFTITREQQQDATLDFLFLYFDYWLKKNAASWNIFLDSLSSSPRIENSIDCLLLSSRERNKDNFLLFPNPVRDQFRIILPGHLRNDYSIRIFSLSGEILKEEQHGPVPSEIDVSSFSPGFYTVEIVVPSGRYFSKLIKY